MAEWTKEDVQEYVEGLSDAALLRAKDEAENDLAYAARTRPNSEWHSACFAGFLTYAMEVQRRGLIKEYEQ